MTEPQSFEDEESFDDFEFDPNNNAYQQYMKKQQKKNGNQLNLIPVGSESSITFHNFSSLNSSLKHIKDIKGKSYDTSGVRDENESLDFNEDQSNTHYTHYTHPQYTVNDEDLTMISEDIQNENTEHNPMIKGYTEIEQ